MCRGAATFIKTKNKDTREIYLSSELLNVLKHRGAGCSGEHVFLQKNGTPYSEPPRSFETAVDRLALNENRGSLDQLTFHTLRHTAATFAARCKTSPKDMQIIFGWKTPAMVFRYVKGDEDAQREAMSGLALSLTAESVKSPLKFSGLKPRKLYRWRLSREP